MHNCSKTNERNIFGVTKFIISGFELNCSFDSALIGPKTLLRKEIKISIDNFITKELNLTVKILRYQVAFTRNTSTKQFNHFFFVIFTASK